MINTPLTRDYHLRFPIIGAPMAGVAEAELALAITKAGGLGMVGIGSSASPAFIEKQGERLTAGGPFGLGLMVWALKQRPDLLDAALEVKPTLISLSFGDPTPYIERCHARGVRVAVQVHDRTETHQALVAGADLLVAQGTEAGGHTGTVATLPLLQLVLRQAGSTPVAAAGGIATPPAVAGLLAMGAAGVWVGTAFIATPESRQSSEGRAQVIASRETDTILTHVYDRLQQLAWPDAYAGRALANEFTRTWHGREADMLETSEAREHFLSHRGDYSVDYIYAGQAVGLIEEEQTAADIVAWLGSGAEEILKRRCRDLFPLDPA